MTRIKYFLLAPLAVLLMGPAASGHTADRGVDGSEPAPASLKWWAGTAKTLASRGDIDSVFTAGVILQSGLAGPDERERGQQFVRQAAQRDPASADLAAMAMLGCTEQDGCDPGAYVERYRHTTPHDARAWLPALIRATKRRDEAAITRTLAHMAAAHRFRGYWIELMERFHRAFSHVSPLPGAGANPAADPDGARWSTALNLASAVAIPGYQSLTLACKPDNSAFPSRESDCRRIGQLLTHGETLVQNRIGSRLLEWTARNAGERDAVLAMRHTMRWQKSAAGRLEGAADWADALLKYRSESRAIEARLERAGLPLDPPKDWSE
ncbi:MAG: hypothetical protein ACREPZ_01190 [Rhodanobacteraceae bacterium]